ncbi:hypothetical protein C1645_412472 [Glomus cerebriforme]|uniref:Uncharacterized protein n=1 Tax=Glomus cerebriforme TaxID=658196 RepID=A0A397SI24_9GLOM|nr:hypothetical protein C1645_412472 [Glomus cerebriforme]
MPSNISHAWYTILVAQDPNNRHATQRSNGCWTVIDYSAGLHVLDLHNEAKVFNFNTKNISIEEQNQNAGYIFSRDQEEERSLIPLLPGYVAFTTAGKKRFKLSILERNNQLLFLWEEFGSDISYTDKKAQGVERLAFHCMLKEYDLESNNTIRSLLGLYDPQIINKLQKLVHDKFPLRYPTIFQQQESSIILSENLRSNAKKKEETLRRSLKRGQEEINTFLCEIDGSSNSQHIRFGIQVESEGKVLSPKDTQVLMLKNLEYKQTIYSQNKTIKKLKNKITSIDNEAENSIETNVTALNDEEIQKSVKKEMEEKQLGSVIFMNTSQYLSILLSLPCPNCLDLIASNRTFYTRVSGFTIFCIITCLLCKTSTQYSNEDSGVKYSHLVAGAALAREINRNSFQTALATIGVINQCCKKSYFNCQARMYKPIIDSAKSSCEAILYEILDNLESIHLPGKEKVLPIGFDCSWAHSRNAHQASGEFLYLGDLPGYNYQPVIGFHTIENSRIIHGDLETNRTLACIPAVSRIFADLKHLSKNIQKNLLKKQYSCWHSFEQHIMRYFNSCIFSAGLQNKLNQDDAPTEKET